MIEWFDKSKLPASDEEIRFVITKHTTRGDEECF